MGRSSYLAAGDPSAAQEALQNSLANFDIGLPPTPTFSAIELRLADIKLHPADWRPDPATGVADDLLDHLERFHLKQFRNIEHPMATYVLVHGAFHGAWCWKKLIPLLQAAGHQVFAPSLTGLGERANLLTPDVGLSTHIQDIVQVIENSRLEEVILVGHSEGAMVITGVVDQIPEQVGHLVFLDTFVPKDGESMADVAPLVIRIFRR